MKKIIVLLLVAFCTTACAAYVEEEARFVGYNVSGVKVVALVNDGGGWEIPANGSIKFTTQVPVPKNPVQTGYGSYGSTGPSTIDKVVQISVAFRNLRTGKLTVPIFCYAGAKIVTTVWYEVSGSYESARCNY